MTIIGKKSLASYLKIFLDLVFFGGLIIFIGLPFFLKWYVNILKSSYHENYYFLIVFLYFTGFFALYLFHEVRKVFKTLNRKNPFMMDNVISLKRISICCFIISFAYIIKIFFYNSILTMIITMIFIIGGLFIIVMAEVFKQAVEYKEENDLTI
ncbi:MAG: DUF2975 domain-containing protein [Bacillota bacterium]|nr:DUF2975 domain-containing protein [Bacillota bacterium]